MKIKLTNPLFFFRGKLLRIIMRAFIFLLCTSVFGLTPNNIVSQNAKVNIDTDITITVDEVFQLISDQTDYKFIYQSDLFNDFPKVELKKGIIKVNKLLKQSLSNGDFKISFTNANTIFIEESANQNITITGFVADAKGDPLAGVTVLLDGANRGTTTNYDGRFQIRAEKATGILVFSSIGYKTKRVNYVEGIPLSVKMEEELSALDEVTIVAYGETNKREMTGSVSTIKSEDIKDIPSSSVANLLQGRLSGVSVTNSSGAPGGGGTNIVIRGFNSLGIEAGRRFSNPLWIVDGVPMSSFTSPVTGTNGLADLNPEVIESIDVLKDASATSLYGSRAANGVILVTTKKGRKNQKGNFTVNYSETLSVLPEYPTVYGGRGERIFKINGRKAQRNAYFDPALGTWIYPGSYEEAWGELGTFDGFWGNGSVDELKDGFIVQDSLNAFYNNSTNFYKKIYREAKIRNANIQTYGGGENMSYSIGLGYYDEEGIVVGTGFKRTNLLGNFRVQPVDKLSLNLNNYLSLADRSRGVRGGGLASGRDIELVPDEPYNLSTLLPFNNQATEDAVQRFKSQEEKNITYRLRSSLQLQYDFSKDINISNTVSVDFSQNNRNSFRPAALSLFNESESAGEISRNITFLNESLLNYKTSINDNHNIGVVLGVSFQRDVSHYVGGSARGGPSDLVKYVGKEGWPNLIERSEFWIDPLKTYRSDFLESKLHSLFGRLNYNYKKKYLLTATMRRDGSSVFGRNLRWATFPSVGLGWNFSEEKFMQGFKSLDFAKLRASYGLSGNTFSSPYLAYGVLESRGVYNGQATIAPNWGEGFYNPNLSWEETRQLDIGVDFNFFNYRLSVTADYYNRHTKDLLYKVELPGNYSTYQSQWINAAAIVNHGFELEFKYDVFRDKQDFWRVSLNLAKNYNRFADSFNDRDILDLNEKKYFVLGREINSIYGFKTDGFIQTDDEVVEYYNSNGELNRVSNDFSQNSYHRPGDVKFVDVNGDFIIDYRDQVYLGSTLPDVTGGLINEVRWKNFDLNMLFSFSFGRDMVNTAASESILIETAAPLFINADDTFWQQPGDNPDYPIYRTGAFNSNFVPIQDRLIEHVHYVKLKTLTLGYTLPKTLFKKKVFDSVRFFFSGENLFTITNYSGLDPETVNITTGIDNGKTFPLARKLTLGLTIKL
ncbi:SusC/RagA family TonB-linked outer membrane protein [Flavivirga eckloniae]|uniref:SusC/RagA family TonB-linked outer membrane protein n=1 Tax=Flavivirga eckloniae TaxID=1803846 RepID=A0A2K9PSZ1_9FLAO|nr:TonB-dependent receptor [Flavivirga eckloniae]AUP80175.1 SusC/RagA family TonB-linked outer membrane protein [Flavivirga eckloniae]